MKISETLIQARALIEDEAHWTQGFYAQITKAPFVVDVQCGVLNRQASCYCSLGAVTKVAYTKGKPGEDFNLSMKGREYLHKAARRKGFISMIELNDTGIHADVLKAFDLAIEMARKKETQP